MNLNFSIKDLWDRLQKEFVSKKEYRNKDVPSKVGGVTTVTKLYTSDDEMNMDTNVPDGTIGGVTHYGWRTMQEIVEDAGGDYDNTYVEIPDITGTDVDKVDIKWINPEFEDKASNITWTMLYSTLAEAVFRTTVTDPDSLSKETVRYPVLFTDSEGNEYSLVADQIGIPVGFRPRWVNIIYILRTSPKEGGRAKLWVADATDGTFKFSSEAYSNDSKEFYSAMAQHKNMNWLKTYVNNVIAALESRAGELDEITDEIKASIKAMFYRLFTCPAPMSRILHIRESGKWTNIQNTISFDSVEEMHKYTTKDGDIGVVENWSYVEVTDENVDEWKNLSLENIPNEKYVFYHASNSPNFVSLPVGIIAFSVDLGPTLMLESFNDLNDTIKISLNPDSPVFKLINVNKETGDTVDEISYYVAFIFSHDPMVDDGNGGLTFAQGAKGKLKICFTDLNGSGDLSTYISNINNGLVIEDQHWLWYADNNAIASKDFTYTGTSWVADRSNNRAYIVKENYPNIDSLFKSIWKIDPEEDSNSTYKFSEEIDYSSFSSFINIHIPQYTRNTYTRINNEWKGFPEVILLYINPEWNLSNGIGNAEDLNCSKSDDEIIDLVNSGVQVILKDINGRYYYPAAIEKNDCKFSNVLWDSRSTTIYSIHIHRASEAEFSVYSIASTTAIEGLENRMNDLETALESMRQDMLDNELVTTQAIQALAPSNS